MSNYQKLQNEFDEFDMNNPKIWELLVRFSHEAKNAGVESIGVKLLVERIRWEIQIETKSSDNYKINNNHSAFYARKLMNEYPELNGLFKIRMQK